MTERRKVFEEKIRQLVIGKFNLDIDPQDISAEQSLVELGVGVDSVSTLEFIMELEEEFGILIDESQVGPEIFETVEKIVEFIASFR